MLLITGGIRKCTYWQTQSTECKSGREMSDDDREMSRVGDDERYKACIQHYWQQYSYITSWIANCQQKFSLSSSKPDFCEWCRQMCSYHATMAYYMHWNYSAAVGSIPPRLDYDWHGAACARNMMQSSPIISGSKFHKKSGKGRRRQKRRSQARRRSHLSSAGGIELHIANIDRDGGGLDVELGDGNENFEFEFEITDDLVEFFAETARHRRERGAAFANCHSFPLVDSLDDVLIFT